MTAVLSGLAATAAALALAPAALRHAHAHLRSPHRFAPVEVAATATATGLAAGASLWLGHLALTLGPLLVLGVAAAVVDAVEQRLPDPLTAGLGITALAVAGAHSVLAATPEPVIRGLLAASTVTGLALLVKLTSPGAVGWGDVKLLPGLAAVLGSWRWEALFAAVVLWALFLAATTAGAACARGKAWSTPVPYGPALLVGTLAALVV